ncbi:LytTR family DNA-binding domain-containing protein [Heyndrickxia oleronia]|jgi:DNA-binding LytR/AlgR family response regulator|uniref:LytTR family DNA-binding domain-containing protein n=1 Tax=Heyndrickxia oleronia TaxID=38875 RepID=UPI002431A578|nr:LytTR family DNA-binding domain-containing protein [Heyndrickxia oleronia]MCI1591152.1 LytTR family transcriptional regulator DNA-binding domain-containing protein [Heyndrickxia oleronia]MCI1615019.1 LytTR family transcriptional regulator DNA-binding domain-containing protein [Heyndrickxia oleronia]MCI1745855.1 LytTR family transcriptional regulator DNA-binding domain-containing protein [Heyndrickxia oleronia]MCI1762919.1 LytTR family transcriptional regulator DNA-binding domain-containing p
MQIKLIIDEKIEETEIQIHANTFTDEIEQIMKFLKSSKTEVIDGYLKQEIYMLKISEIFFVYSEGAKVYFQTDEDEYESKLKLYEVEEILEKDFVRVNKSTLVNISKISYMKMEKIGMMQLVMENGTTAHVSRKYLKNLKKRLGIGRDGK